MVKPTSVVCGLGRNRLDVIGETEVVVDNAGPIKVLVTRNLPHALLLGSDSLARGKGVINYEENKMTWYGQEYPLLEYPDHAPQINDLYVAETTGQADIDEVIQRYQNVFSTPDDPLGFCDLISMKINTGNARPIYQRPYRTPLAKRKIVEDQIKQMLQAGVIEPSTSPWASPITLAPKPEGQTRFCCDYRKLNAVTVRDSYPLPLISDIFDQLGGATVFSTLDLKSGYWQIPVAPEDRPKTSFCSHLGLYQYRRVPFGLCNAPSLFQRVMDSVLQDLIGKVCYVYIDDVVVYSKNREEHAKHVEMILQRLQEHGLKVNKKKCQFGCSEVALLGYIISADGISTHPDKTKDITNMDAPRSVKEVRSFLGMTGYYRQAIPSYAAISALLTALTKKHVRWHWTEEHEQAFRALQELLVSSHVLAYPRTDKPYKLYTDASKFAVGGILVQDDENGVEKVVQYVSHQLSTAQQKWCAMEREAYAIIYCLHKLRPYLWGARFEILTDHKPLRAMFQNELANSKVQRWAMLIQEYGAPIRYRKGKHNIRADMLSRIRPMEIDVVDTADYVEPQLSTVTWSLPLKFDGIDKQALSEAQKETFKEQWDKAVAEDGDYEVQEGILFSCRRPGAKQALYPRVMLPPQWRDDVIDRCHRQTGHSAPYRTMASVREAYVWPGMKKDVKARLMKCGACQLHKTQPEHFQHGRISVSIYGFGWPIR